MNHETWLREMFEALDREGVPGLFPYLTEDVLFRFASYPAGRGRDTFAGAWAAMSESIRCLEHRLEGVQSQDDGIFCHGLVTYHLKEGGPVTAPFATRFVMKGREIAEYHIYVDASAVLGAAPNA